MWQFGFAFLKKKSFGRSFKSVKNAKMADFFGHNFLEARWRQAALKNGYALLGHRRYYDAIAFFLIGGSLKDAIDIAQNRSQDFQLAILIAILYSGQDTKVDDSIIFDFYRFISRHPLYLKALSINPGIGGQSVGTSGLLRESRILDSLQTAINYNLKLKYEFKNYF